MRGARAVLALALLLCCGGAERTPARTVERYLDALASDPVRSLELLTPGFHARHGLRFEEVAEQPFGAPARTPTPGGDAELELERARLGWLTLLTKRIFAFQLPRLERRVVSEEVRGDAARVLLRIEPLGLDARFELRRSGPAEPWRVDAVELPPVSDAELVAAFLIAPDAERSRRLATRRRAPAGR